MPEQQEETLPYGVEVVSLDHPGIVHRLANFFSQRNINIIDLNTTRYAAPHTGTSMFAVQMNIGVPAKTSIGELREEFLEFCDDMNLDAVMEPTSRSSERNFPRRQGKMVEIGKKVPDVELLLTGDKHARLSDYQAGGWCSTSTPRPAPPAAPRRGSISRRRSTSSAASPPPSSAPRATASRPRTFQGETGFPFDLVADTEEKLCEAFGVIKMKNMYGKQVRGIERSTFLIDDQGILRHECVA